MLWLSPVLFSYMLGPLSHGMWCTQSNCRPTHTPTEGMTNARRGGGYRLNTLGCICSGGLWCFWGVIFLPTCHFMNTARSPPCYTALHRKTHHYTNPTSQLSTH